MVSIITTGGSLGISHYNEIEKMSSQDGVLTVRNNGKENCLTAGRSLAERFIIVLNSTCLGSLSFIKGLYAALEHREAKAIECFSAALVNIYGEGVNDIVNTHLNGKGKIELSDISTIIDKVTKAKSSYRECDDGDREIEGKIKLSFADFDISHVNKCDSDLFDSLSNKVDGLISNIGGRNRFNPESMHYLRMVLMDFITSMPASSDTFMSLVSNMKNDAVIPDYHINEINLNKRTGFYITAENMNTLLKGTGLLKEELLLSGVQDACRHQVYAARFNEGVRENVDTASRKPPSVSPTLLRPDIERSMASSQPSPSSMQSPPLPSPPSLLAQQSLSEFSSLPLPPPPQIPLPPRMPPPPFAALNAEAKPHKLKTAISNQTETPAKPEGLDFMSELKARQAGGLKQIPKENEQAIVPQNPNTEINVENNKKVEQNKSEVNLFSVIRDKIEARRLAISNSDSESEGEGNENKNDNSWND
ncbi:Uncharacterised protein [Yersinia aldovae]|uniref:hypothetical protein n=1 Tax=Yersinia aldovae TaxID=29483 RepID=UPI0005E06896|nr:hypothetical protein [Yersinia aldovae]CNI34384.1 Uncharacterised protein [Yersinia aldovae]